MLRRFFLLIALSLPAIANQYQLGSLVISHPWSRPTAPGMPMGVAYLSITNRGKDAEVLVSVCTPVAARVEIHQTTIVDGMARMRPLGEIEIAPGATVKIEPGGIHLMLVDLAAALDQHGIIRDFLGQGMFEGIFYLWERRLFVNELRCLEVGQHPAQFHLWCVYDVLEQTEGELFAKH